MVTNGFTWAAAQHDGYKTPTEDRYTVLPLRGDALLVGVFDGHGGSAASQHVNSELPRQIQRRLDMDDIPDMPDVATYVRVLSEEFASMWHEVYQVLSIEGVGGGTTASVAIVTATHIITAKVGDSPMFLYSEADKRILFETIDHDCNNQDELQRIGNAYDGRSICRPRQDGTMGVMGDLAMTRSFGDFYLSPYGIIATPDIHVIERPHEASTLIVSSDSFAERLQPHLLYPDQNQIRAGAGPSRIVRDIAVAAEQPDKLVSADPPMNNPDLAAAVQNTVAYQVNKFFWPPHYNGDNTTLVAVRLPGVGMGGGSRLSKRHGRKSLKNRKSIKRSRRM